jgi:hypothetical protein
MLIARTFSVLCFAALLCAPLDAFSQESSSQAPQVETQEQPKSRLQAEQPNDQKADRGQQPPLGPEKIGAQGSQRERGSDTPEGDQQGSEFWSPLYGYRLKVTDTLLIAVTFLLFWATLALWLSTRQLVKGAEITAERQLRAYVFVTGTGLLEPHETHDWRFVHQFKIQNTGITPAYKLRVESLTRPHAHPIPQDFDFDITPPGRNPSVMMLAAGQTVEHHSLADEPLSEADLISLKSQGSARRLYTFGTVYYEDAFGRERFTNFCYFLEWERRPKGYAFNVHPSEHHNDAN